MLGDADLQSLDGSLRSMVQENQTHHRNLQSLVNQFQSLLESYNRLKSDYEEEKDGRERYKKLARAQERNPFVLVLVDGDGYLFKEHLLRAGAQGGVAAARILSDSIKELVQEQLGSQADQCRIMVVGNEARSLSTFASSFTRAQDLFDYIDAGDKKEGADYKIREMFRLFVDNNQCKHIFFAGCHDSGYLSLLTPYRGCTDRITLIKAASFHYDYENLALSIRELPAVFMSTQMGGTQMPHAPSTAPSKPVCKHYQKGTCAFGSKCNKLHVTTNQSPFQELEKTPPTGPAASRLSTSSNCIRDQEYYARYLPSDTKSEGYIAVNKDGERLDYYCAPPSQEAWEGYQRRAKVKKLCNNHFIGGYCENASCDFDHNPLDPASLDVMKHILRQHVCPRGSRCRAPKCYVGHHCQRAGCKGGKPCKFGRQAHHLNLVVAQWEMPIDHEPEASSVSEGSLDAVSTTESTSGTGQPPSPIRISM